MRDFSEKIIRNTLFNIAGNLWGTLVYVLLTPYIISKIGIEGYGIWTIIYVFIGYVALLDQGYNTSYVKFISEYFTKKDYTRINEVINTSFAFYLVFSLIVFVFLFPLRDLFFSFFRIPPDFIGDAVFVLFTAIIIFLFASTFEIFSAILNGIQRMDVTNKLTIFMTFPKIAGTFLFLEKGMGIKGLVLNEGIVIFFSILFTLFIAKRILPEIQIRKKYIRYEMFKNLFHFGIKLQVSRLAALIVFHFDKILITHYVGIGFVTFYDLGSKIVRTARQFPILLSSAVVPAASELQAGEETEKIYSLFLRSTKYVASFGLPLMLFSFIVGPQILYGWMGKEYPESVVVLRVLSVGYFANMIAGPISHIVQGIGKPLVQMRASLIILFMNIPLSLFLVIRIGFLGAAIGTSIAMIAGTVYYYYSFNRLFSKPIWTSLKDLFIVPVFVSLVVGLLLILLFSFLSSTLHGSRIGSLVSVGIVFPIYFCLYTFLLFKFGYFDSVDRWVLRGLLRISKVMKTS